MIDAVIKSLPSPKKNPPLLVKFPSAMIESAPSPVLMIPPFSIPSPMKLEYIMKRPPRPMMESAPLPVLMIPLLTMPKVSLVPVIMSFPSPVAMSLELAMPQPR
jgi:hypothetical protein